MLCFHSGKIKLNKKLNLFYLNLIYIKKFINYMNNDCKTQKSEMNESELSENNKCDCNEFYKLELFDDKCSKCFYQSNPEKYLEIVKTVPIKYHTSSFLQNYVYKNRIPNNSSYLKILEEIISEEKNFKIEYLKEWIMLVSHDSKYNGISTKQAIKILNKHKHNYSNKYKLQHILCGLIIDWWNLTDNAGALGAVTCYYDNNTHYGTDVELLKYGNNIKNAPAFSNNIKEILFWSNSISFFK